MTKTCSNCKFVKGKHFKFPCTECSNKNTINNKKYFLWEKKPKEEPITKDCTNCDFEEYGLNGTGKCMGCSSFRHWKHKEEQLPLWNHKTNKPYVHKEYPPAIACVSQADIHVPSNKKIQKLCTECEFYTPDLSYIECDNCYLLSNYRVKEFTSKKEDTTNLSSHTITAIGHKEEHIEIRQLPPEKIRLILSLVLKTPLLGKSPEELDLIQEVITAFMENKNENNN